MIILLLLLITVSMSGRRTITHGNKNSFVPSSYGGLLNINQDELISNQVFRNKLISTQKYIGKYCVGGECEYYNN